MALQLYSVYKKTCTINKMYLFSTGVFLEFEIDNLKWHRKQRDAFLFYSEANVYCCSPNDHDSSCHSVSLLQWKHQVQPFATGLASLEKSNSTCFKS